MKYFTRGLKEILIISMAVLAAVALMLPSFIPDFIPFIGFADESFWTLILINTAGYYGLNLSALYGDNKTRKVVRRIKKRKPSDETVTDENGRMVIRDNTSTTPVIEEK
ncbi:MAG: hypothetical protein SH821_17170 [Phototrophicales bacterium]|nr:hypothetical protein [Phototrophicales bacterium]